DNETTSPSGRDHERNRNDPDRPRAGPPDPGWHGAGTVHLLRPAGTGGVLRAVGKGCVLRHDVALHRRLRLPVDCGQWMWPVTNPTAAGPPHRGIAGDQMNTVDNETLWRDYRTRLVAFVAKRVADEATAEDIVHDVLVRAWDRRDTLRAA